MTDRELQHAHPHTDVCTEGKRLYERALSEEVLSREAAAGVPCLLLTGLVQPDADDPGLLRPVPPSLGVGLLLARRRREYQEHMTQLTESLGSMSARPASTRDGSVLRVAGVERINERLDNAVAECEGELLTMQPTAARTGRLELAGARDVPLLQRGVRLRTLYVHASRFVPEVMAYQERIREFPVQVRTLPGVSERMIVADEKVAFIPANDERTDALEIRHRPLVRALRRCFDSLWGLGTPLWEPVDYGSRGNGVSAMQRVIARMLVEGHDDQEIARRLGLNIRTVRGHVARLASALSSRNRAQLGYLIARSGLVDEWA
ncbi:hypothetical protein SRB5_43710 [Streptomyces sp. RB5]|uniref:HTH luxR-type domain-containing protein n=1 Tax=Streptomyces smaragdinus TaxID=2585196 RepID=A0A7K0CL49_9ACTN|nr:LuxR C-terminal-related transcriptional regulator [Streptomyces smaragdinus]MQY14209.1 hypothetical protein [Streptomyces smaragdinus]